MRSFALLLALTITLPAYGQSSDLTTAVDLMARLSYLRETSVQVDLKMTDEQIGKLVQLPGLGSGGRIGGTLSQATETWKQAQAILSPEQVTRLQQIIWQQTRSSGTASLLSRSEIQAALKLSEEQVSQARSIATKHSSDRRSLDRTDETTYRTKSSELLAAANRQTTSLLSADQNAKLKELLGAPFEGALRSANSFGSFQGGRGPGAAGPGGAAGQGGFGGRGTTTIRTLPFRLGQGASPLSSLVRSEPIQKELKLTEEQVKQASALQTGGFAPNGTVAFLSSEQLERLNQLTLQYANQRYGPLGVMRYRSAVETLALSDEQKRAIETLAEEDRTAVNALGTSPEAEKLAAVNRQIGEKLDQALSPQQKEKVKQLLGQPYAGTIQPAAPTGFGGGGPSYEIGSVTRTAWSYLRYPDVQKDLKLSEEQTKSLPDVTGRTSNMETQIRKVLSAEQIARLSQIQLQISKQRYGLAYTFRYRDVADALKLTEEQKPKVLALVQTPTRTTTLPADNPVVQQQVEEILTDEQKAKLKELLGPRFEGEVPPGFSPAGAGGAAGGGPGSGGFGSPQPIRVGETAQPITGWLRYAPIRDELKLTEEQSQKVTALVGPRGATNDAEVVKALTAEQVARLRQIQLQQVQRQSGAAYLFRYREVAEPLALSDEQKQKIEALSQTRSRRGMSTTELEQLRSDVNALLSAEQRSKFDDLLGKPFALDTRALFGAPSTRGGDRGSRDRN